jgi:hypothetical protein
MTNSASRSSRSTRSQAAALFSALNAEVEWKPRRLMCRANAKMPTDYQRLCVMAERLGLVIPHPSAVDLSSKLVTATKLALQLIHGKVSTAELSPSALCDLGFFLSFEVGLLPALVAVLCYPLFSPSLSSPRVWPNDFISCRLRIGFMLRLLFHVCHFRS